MNLHPPEHATKHVMKPLVLNFTFVPYRAIGPMYSDNTNEKQAHYDSVSVQHSGYGMIRARAASCG